MSLLDRTLASLSSLRAGTRRGLELLVLLILVGLAFFPRHYVARTKVIPPGSSNAGLGALLSQLGGLASFAPLLNSRQPIELYLVIAKSNDVATGVVERLGLESRFGVRSAERAVLRLRDLVEVNALRGGVLEFEVMSRNPAQALDIASAYAAVFQDRLSTLAKDEIARKSSLVKEQLSMSERRLADAEAALTSYRTTNRMASPEAQLGSSVSLLATMEARLQAKEVERTTVLQFATPSNIDVQRIESEISSLKAQIARAREKGDAGEPFGFRGFAQRSTEYLLLYRNLKYAEALFEVYSRYLEAVNVEAISANINAQVVERPHIDPEWHVNRWALIVLAIVSVLVAVVEVRASGRRSTAHTS
jgi:capsule polysaccharide export protein KpsE/RkpR